MKGQGQRSIDPRPYATAMGFYIGDEVEIAPEGILARVVKTYGSWSNAVTVRCENGTRVTVEDFDLTRVG